MSILHIKDVEAYDNDVVKVLRFFEFPGQSINFESSSRYKQLKYKSDYDIILFIKNTTPPHVCFMRKRFRTDRNKAVIHILLNQKYKQKMKINSDGIMVMLLVLVILKNIIMIV